MTASLTTGGAAAQEANVRSADKGTLLVHNRRMSLNLRLGPMRVGTRSAGLRFGPLSASSSYRGVGGLVMLPFTLMIAMIQLTVWLVVVMFAIAAATVKVSVAVVAYAAPRARPLATRLYRWVRARQAGRSLP